MQKKLYDIIILGGGTAGLFCAYLAKQKGLKIAVIEHNQKLGVKLSLAGGGMGNMSNLFLNSDHYISHDNEQKNTILKKLLKEFSCQDVIKLLNKFEIPFEEREFGQIFCLKPVKLFIEKLISHCQNVDFYLGAKIKNTIYKLEHNSSDNKNYHILLEQTEIVGSKLVLASGSTSYPQVGGSDFGLRLAKKWGHQIHNFSPALVPFILDGQNFNSEATEFPNLLGLQGISLKACVSVLNNDHTYTDPCKARSLLFTHQGISGPAILVASCHWKKGDKVKIDFLPDYNLIDLMHLESNGKKSLKNLLLTLLPDRLVYRFLPLDLQNKKVAELSKKHRQFIAKLFHNYICIPKDTQGLKKAEVATGGVSLNSISDNFESLNHKNLFFCGELIDITGFLGGYNIHFALASAQKVVQSL